MPCNMRMSKLPYELEGSCQSFAVLGRPDS